MNQIILLGNMTRNPEITINQKGKKFAKYDIAVNRSFKSGNGPETDYFHCISFGKQADFLEKYFQKGSRILIVGRAQNNNYTNKNGEKVYSYQVITEKVEFGDTKRATPIEATPAGEPQASNVTEDFTNIEEMVGNSEMPFS